MMHRVRSSQKPYQRSRARGSHCRTTLILQTRRADANHLGCFGRLRWLGGARSDGGEDGRGSERDQEPATVELIKKRLGRNALLRNEGLALPLRLPCYRPHPRFRETTVLRKPVGPRVPALGLDASGENETDAKMYQGRYGFVPRFTGAAGSGRISSAMLT